MFIFLEVYDYFAKTMQKMSLSLKQFLEINVIKYFAMYGSFHFC